MPSKRQRKAISQKCWYFGIPTCVNLDSFVTVLFPSLPSTTANADTYTGTHKFSTHMHWTFLPCFLLTAQRVTAKPSSVPFVFLCCSIMQDLSPDAELSRPSGLRDGDAKEQKVEQHKKQAPCLFPCTYADVCLYNTIYIGSVGESLRIHCAFRWFTVLNKEENYLESLWWHYFCD